MPEEHLSNLKKVKIINCAAIDILKEFISQWGSLGIGIVKH